MSLSLPYDITLDGGVNASHVQSNFQTIADKFGALEAADMPTLALPSAQLTASSVEEFINLEFKWGTVIPGVAATALTTGIKSTLGVHGTGVYTIAGGRVDYNFTGGTPAAGNTFTVLAGEWAGLTNTFTTTSTLVNTTSVYTSATAVSGSSNLTINTSTFTGPMTIALNITAVNGTQPTSGTLSVTLRVTRGLQ